MVESPVLARKLLRDLGRNKGQFLAVGLVTLLGVQLFVAGHQGYLDLVFSYDAIYKQLFLADLTLRLPEARREDVEAVASLDGVAAAELRMVLPRPVELQHGRRGEKEVDGLRVEGRLIGLPDRGQSALNQLYLETGSFPLPPGGLVVEKHFASYHHIEVGDSLSLDLCGRQRWCRVAGVAVSPEYLWVAKNDQDIMPSPAEFGVFWIARADLAAFAAATGEAETREATEWERLAADENAGNEILVDLARSDRVVERIRDLLGARLISVTARKDLVGVRLLKMDVDSIRGVASFFPLLFLIVGATISFSLMARMIDAERPAIATMLALGLPARRVLFHYLTLSTLIGVLASLLGAGSGLLLGRELTLFYASVVNVPLVTSEPRWLIVGVGCLAGTATAFLASLLPALRASRLSPAQGMRTPPPPKGLMLKKLGPYMGRLPIFLRQCLRDCLRRPLRSLATAFGVAAALVLVVTVAAVTESIEKAVSLQFDKAQAYDVRVDLLRFDTPARLEAAVAELIEAEDIETVSSLVVQLEGHSGISVLHVIGPESRLLRSIDFEGREVTPRRGGLVIGKPLASELGLAVGDTATLRILPFGRPLRLRVDGLNDNAVGSSAIATRSSFPESSTLHNRCNTALIRVKDDDGLATARKLERMPGLVRLQDMRLLRSQVDELLQLSYTLLAFMLGFAAALAASILFNTATLNVLERRRELGVMRAMGAPWSRVAWMVTVEHGLLAVVGLLLGLPMSVMAIEYTLSLYESELFHLPFLLSAKVVILSFSGCVAVLLAAQWPALRWLRGRNLGEEVRSRDT